MVACNIGGGLMSSNKPSKISVLLDNDEFSRFEAYCESQGYKKSTLIARLIREHLHSEGFTIQQPFPFAKKQHAYREGNNR